MAQYGRNYYGGSYYGQSGVFAGQFVSDKTSLITPLTSESEGKLLIEIACQHPLISYGLNDTAYIKEGTWNNNISSDPSLKIIGSLIASNFYIKYGASPIGSLIDVEVKTYVNGELQDTVSHIVDTTETSPYLISGLTFGEQIITITKNAGATPESSFEFNGIDAIVTDLKLEMRSGTADEYGEWINVPLIMTKDNSSNYPSFSNVYLYEGETPSWVGVDGYQFKLMIASSDNYATPEVIRADIHTGSMGEYSRTGFWKTTIELEESMISLDKITFDATNPDDTKMEIRTRTGDVDGIWGPWSLPYSNDISRVMIDWKTNNTIVEGYVLTPIIAPENIATWQNFKLRHFLNSIDRLTGVLSSGSSITVDVVTADYHPNPQTIGEYQTNQNLVLGTFEYTTDAIIERNISSLKNVSLRFKINFNRNGITASPAVEHLFSLSNAEYTQYRTFGTGVGEINAYGSAVYNAASGVDRVYIDGIGRNIQASIPSLNFTLPSGVVSPEYSIEVDNTFSEMYPADEVSIYWNSNSVDRTSQPDDYLMVRVQEPIRKGRIKKHFIYGSGIATIITPNYQPIKITSTFSPSLIEGRKYAYHIRNGFQEGNPNPNIDIRWAIESDVAENNRRHISHSPNSELHIGIIQSTRNGIIDWISEEKKFTAIVNKNDILQPHFVTLLYNEDPALSQIPEIEPGIILNADPLIIPYEIQIVEGSVTSHGVRKPGDIINTNVRYINSSFEGTPSLKTEIEEKVLMIRAEGTNVDRLPKAMIKKINGTENGKTLGIYKLTSDSMPRYTNKINPINGTELEYGDYRFYAPTGSYSNSVDWSPGIWAGTAPLPGEKYYVTYVYDKVISLRVETSCDYSEYEPILQIYRSPIITREGECSPTMDYVSEHFDIADFLVPDDVDKSTLKLVVYDNNPRVRTYTEDGRVHATLDGKDPRVSWNPQLHGGSYHINKDNYYMFVNPIEYTLDASLIPISKNISYVSGYSGSGMLVEEDTVNLAPSFERQEQRSTSFLTTFNELT